ncbi:MAG: hypothetical protein QE263_09495 [Vampirovibrionales bacterium]|nr:hypothetical protein [Vampirovibrionales bacterium]
MASLSTIAQRPFSVLFEENQVLNRQFIELGGYLPSDMMTARNKFERAEKILDHGFWLLVAVLSPVVLGRWFLNAYQKRFEPFGLPKVTPAPLKQKGIMRAVEWVERLGKHSPLQIPFEWLESSQTAVRDPLLVKRIAHNLGLESAEALEKLLSDPNKGKAFRSRALNGKLLILGLDLLLMASNAQIKLWLKNYITPWLSGKKGFSGTLNYTTDKFRDEKTKDYESHKKSRMLQSLGLWGVSIVGLPLLMAGILKNPAKVGQGFLGQLKRAMPVFNYADTIFMSKWTFIWYSAFNYVLGGALAARDGDERREHLVKACTLDFFFAFGDTVFAGLGALGLQRWLARKGETTPLYERKGVLPVPRSLDQVFAEVGNQAKHVSYRAAQANYWMGLVLTTVCMGLSIPLLNNHYTKQKVLKEQQAMYTQLWARFQNLPAVLKPLNQAYAV